MACPDYSVKLSRRWKYTAKEGDPPAFVEVTGKPDKLVVERLYNNASEQHTARKLLCEALSRALASSDFSYDSKTPVQLYAYGQVDNSYVQLVAMYLRMGFRVHRVVAFEEEVEGKGLSEEEAGWLSHLTPRSVATPRIAALLGGDNWEDRRANLVMRCPLGKLLDWGRMRGFHGE